MIASHYRKKNIKVENTKLEILSHIGFWWSLFIIILTAVILRAKFLNSFPLSPDEGIHLIWLRLLSAGYRPYEQIYITYPPLYPLMLEAVWNIWPTLEAQRWLSVVFTIFGAMGIALLARKFAGVVTGVVAITLFLFSPTMFSFSRAILGEFPSVAWSVWAVWLAWLYQERGRRVLLVLSGLCLAASLLTKLLSPFLLVLIPLMLAARQVSINRSQTQNLEDICWSVKWGRYTLRVTDYKSLLLDLLLWGSTLLLTVIIFVFMFDVKSLFAQVVNQRLEASVAYAAEGYWQNRYSQGVQFFQDDMALVILALCGLGVAWRRCQKNLWLMLVWLALAWAMLLIHTPVRNKHFLILLPHLTIFGGLAVSYWLSHTILWFKSLKNKAQAPDSVNHQTVDKALGSTGSGIVTVGGLILLAALLAWQIPVTLALSPVNIDLPKLPPDETKALAFIDEVIAPNDCIITDDMQFLYWSGRLPPPELAEVSANRLQSGALTLVELVNISDRYDCQVVATISNRIAKYLPDYMRWVEYKYRGRLHYGENDFYFAKADTDPKPATPLKADFAGQILLHGYTLPSAPVVSGGRLPLTLVWQAQVKLNTNYAIFVQLRDAKNSVLASADHQPYKGLMPTSAWPKGAVIQEMTWLHLPADIPPGRYNIYLGLYNPQNQERMPLVNDTSGEKALILGPVVVQ